ncbi:MAG TPA: hydantoinase B/oxoprolinase family protein, partial [Paracoccus sp. (in: a-proteobacteria)]|nr:hydantoinase B/oxoprolinase family protein [Paracoccus sp. (in: a-proteobacteria)]
AMHIPMICDRYELRDDQPPGAGEFRGGIGVVKSQRVLTEAFITHESERHTEAPWGIFGGTDGAVGRCVVYNANDPENGREMHSKFSGLKVNADDVMAYYSPNGGGYGDPLKRPPQKVLEDVLDGFCSVDHAREVYGVAVDLDEETVDMAATDKLRRAIRAARQ